MRICKRGILGITVAAGLACGLLATPKSDMEGVACASGVGNVMDIQAGVSRPAAMINKTGREVWEMTHSKKGTGKPSEKTVKKKLPEFLVYFADSIVFDFIYEKSNTIGSKKSLDFSKAKDRRFVLENMTYTDADTSNKMFRKETKFMPQLPSNWGTEGPT